MPSIIFFTSEMITKKLLVLLFHTYVTASFIHDYVVGFWKTFHPVWEIGNRSIDGIKVTYGHAPLSTLPLCTFIVSPNRINKLKKWPVNSINVSQIKQCNRTRVHYSLKYAIIQRTVAILFRNRN